MAGSQHELQHALQSKKKEAAELQQDLVQAASAGQKLVEENERLKRQLLEQSASVTSVGAHVPQDDDAAALRKRLESQDWLAKARDGRSNRLGTEFDDQLLEQRQLEEQHRELQDAYATLQRQLDEEQQARQAAEAAEARSRQERRQSDQQLAHTGSAAQLEDIEQKVRANLQHDYQEQLDELQQTKERSRSEAERLRSELREKSQRLGQAQQEVFDLNREMREKTRKLADAESAAKERQRAKELETMRQSARTMQKSVHQLKRQASLVSTGTAPPPLELSEPHQRGSILDEFRDAPADRQVEELQRENEELLTEVEALRAQLDEVERVQSERSQDSSVDEPVPDPSENHGDSEKAAMVVNALQAQLERARRDALDARERLERYQQEEEQQSLWTKFWMHFQSSWCGLDRATDGPRAEGRRAELGLELPVPAPEVSSS